MRTREWRWLVAALVLAILGAVVCLGGCTRGQRKAPSAAEPRKTETAPTVQKESEPKSTLKAEFGKARILWNDDKGRRIWEAHFREAVASQTGKDSALKLNDVKATLYRNGKAASTMSAPYVVADSRTKEVRASGGVKVVSADDGATASAQEIIWRAENDKITGRGMVRMTKGNITITARSFETDTSLNKARFTEAELGMD